MKPKKLTLLNVGPFTTEVTIDFNKLGEMFLISGNTGSGKTTILDAMTYALYGSLPGSRKDLGPKTLFSHFAKEDAPCFITFYFSLREKEYKVYREPPRPYTKRNGTIDYTDDLVDFFEIKNGVEIKNPGTKTEINQKLVSLLTLTKDEFTRIVLLPQGEFASFLKQKTSDKEKTLGKLFPSEYYSSIINLVKQKATEIEAKYKLQETKLSDILKRFDIVNFSKTQQNLQIKLCSLEKNKKNNLEQTKKLTEEKTNKSHDKELAQNHLKNKQKMEELFFEQEKINDYSKRLKNHNNAEKIMPLIETKKNIAERFEKAQNDLEKADSFFQTTQQKLEEATLNAKKIDSLTKILTENQIKLDSLTECKKIIGQCMIQNKIQEESANNLSNTTEKLLSISNELKELKLLQSENNLLITELPKLHSQSQDFKEKTEKLQKYIDFAIQQIDLENEKHLIIENFKNAELELINNEQFCKELNEQNLALKLSTNLNKNEPCPVCGSLSHPLLAHDKSDYITITEKLSLVEKSLIQAKENFEKQSEKKTKLEERINITEKELNVAKELLTNSFCEIDLSNLDELKNQLTSFTKQNEQLVVQIKNIEKKLSDTQDLEARISDTEKQKNILEEKIPVYKSDFEVSKQMLENFTIQLKQKLGTDHFTSSSINLEFDKTKNQVSLLNTQISDLEQTQQNASLEYTKAISNKENASLFLSERKNEYENATKNVDSAIESSIFDSEDFVTMAILTQNQKRTLENAVSTWNEKITSVKALIDNSKVDYSEENLNQIVSELEDISQQLIDCQNEEANIIKDLTDTKLELDELNNTKEEYDSVCLEKQQLEKTNSVHQRLYNALSGSNPKKTTFDSWYLSLFLDEIAQNASQRLYQMTGRFKMRLGNSSNNKGYKGLDLEVFDCTTGVYCSTNSLSGGETFMASLSLALALTDTVQSKKGGVQLDCLFIDEGFGSLDGAKLDNAIKILDEIRENRKVGIISHVSELKNQMSNILEVVKQPQGNSIVRIVGF